MKVCSKCQLPKDDSEYSRSIRNIKKHSSCNSCRSDQRMDYYERNKRKRACLEVGSPSKKKGDRLLANCSAFSFFSIDIHRLRDRLLAAFSH